MGMLEKFKFILDVKLLMFLTYLWYRDYYGGWEIMSFSDINFILIRISIANNVNTLKCLIYSNERERDRNRLIIEVYVNLFYIIQKFYLRHINAQQPLPPKHTHATHTCHACTHTHMHTFLWPSQLLQNKKKKHQKTQCYFFPFPWTSTYLTGRKRKEFPG